MRKLLLLALALMMVLALGTASAEPAALPAVGDTVEGFVVQEIREFPLIDAQIVLFEHAKTGAKLMYIANDDTNRVFNLSFRTVAINDTGLPHVFEHATLGGSKKYPSKALFFNASMQTYNTYMNASTGTVYTTYPVASLSEAQLLKLADFYTDSCFNPMIMWDESIFREEAWRYRLMSEDAPLTIEGTVYSEMLGAMNLNRKAYFNALHDAFPGSTISNESGGNPDTIPNMTWDDVKNYHDLYYHPSNCIAFLYGEFEDYAAFLRLLDGAFSAYEAKEFDFTDAGYTPLTAPVTNSYAFPVEAGSPTEHVSSIFYFFVVPGATEEQELVLNTMSDLFISSSSGLSQKVKTALPHGEFSCYVETDGPDFALVFNLDNANPEDADVFKAVVDEAVADVAANGFPQDLVDTTAASLAIDAKLIREASAVGVESIIPSFLGYYINTGSPWSYMAYVDALNNLDAWNQEGRYAKAAAELLVGSQTTSLTVTYPQPGAKEEKEAALAAHLEEVKAAMTPEEIADLVAASNAQEETEDTTELIASLQAVTVESLPEEVKEYAIQDTTDEKGIRHITATAGVSGIGQADILLDASHLAVEDLHYARLLVGSIPYIHTSAHTREELASLSDRYLYNRNIRLSFFSEGEDDFHLYMRLGWIAQDEYLAKGYDLMYELIFDMDLDDAESMLAAVKAMKASVRNSINNEPYYVQLYRASGRSDNLTRVFCYTNYVEFYDFLAKAEEQLTNDPAAFMAEMKRVRDQMKNAYGAVTLYAGSAESAQVNLPLANAFLDKLPSEAHERASYDSVPAAAAREGMVIDGSVQFNFTSADLKTLGVEATGDWDAMTALVLDKYLYPKLRDQYGSYGVMHGLSEDFGLYIITYRDPNVKESFQVIDQIADFVAALEVDQDTLNNYILSAYAYYATAPGELSGAVSAEVTYLEGREQTENLQKMQQLKTLTPEKVKAYAPVYATLVAQGVRSTSGGAGVLGKNADLYDVILNPFGVVDSSEVTLDVAEDDPRYEAVRFAFDESLMTAPEGAFRVDDIATKGELACAIFPFAFGQTTDDAAFATENLTPYGLTVPGDPGEPLTVADAQAVLTTLTGFFQIPLDMQFPEDGELTRGGLAQILFDYNNYLEATLGE